MAGPTDDKKATMIQTAITVLLMGQLQANVPPPITTHHPAVVIDQAAPPVVINGKSADQLSDDELLQFLQDKIVNIHHEDGEVQLLRLAPGYPLTLSFHEPYQAVIVGDPQLIKTDKIGRNLVLTALQREGDTSIQLFFPGDKLRVYHVLIAPNFLTGLTAVRVASFTSAAVNRANGVKPEEVALNVRMIAKVIGNYDALLQQKALDPRQIKRLPVFRSNPRTGFTVYYLYQFENGMLALSFAFLNPNDFPIRYDESRLRLQIGNLLFVPGYTSFHRTSLKVGEVTTGFTVIERTGISLEQPFEIVWK